MKHTTVCFLLRNASEPEILLGLKKNGFGAGKFTGIGGKVETGETAKQCALREVGEEIGVRIQAGNIQPRGTVTFVFPSKSEWDQEVFIFTVEKWIGEPRGSNEIEPAWFTLTNIPYDSMWQDAPLWIPAIAEGKMIQARITYREDCETVAEAAVTPLAE